MLRNDSSSACSLLFSVPVISFASNRIISAREEVGYRSIVKVLKSDFTNFLLNTCAISPDFPIRRDEISTVFRPFAILLSRASVSACLSQKYFGPR